MQHNALRVPNISGDIFLDLKTGLFSCRLQLSNLPAIKGYRILLHKGMNIKYFKDPKGKLIDYEGYYSGKAHHIGLEYQLLDAYREPIDDLPQSFSIEYIGAFPIYENDYNSFDFKGYIANNGKTLRATEQSKWYPVLYDVIGDRYIDAYSYDLKIHGKHCRSIFINGSAPLQGEKNAFSSTKPFPLFLFAGDYDYISVAGNYIINASISEKNAQSLMGELEKIKSLYASNLCIAYSDNIYLVNHVPVDKMEPRSRWGFNVYPAFGFAGLDFNDLVSEAGNLACKYVELFAHELAHNYFLSNVMSGKLFWFWLESCADYVSFDAVHEMCGQSYLKKKLLTYIDKIKDEEFLPLGSIEHAHQITEKYRYYVGPLLLKCFELQFGFEKTYEILGSLLTLSEEKTLDLEEWANVCTQHAITEEAFEDFRQKYLLSNTFKEKIVLEIKRYCSV